MIVSRPREFRALTAGAVLLAAPVWLAVAGAAMAQQAPPPSVTPPSVTPPSAPRSLSPIKPQALPPARLPDRPTVGPSPAAPPAAQAAPPAAQAAPPGAQAITPGPIAVDKLREIDNDSAGTLTKEQGGLGIDMWAGTSRRLVERMLPLLPEKVTSPAMRALMRRLLLSTARAPEGPGNKGSLMSLRVGKLAAMGDIAAVDAMLRAAPSRGEDDVLLRLEANIYFLRNDNGRACPLVTGQMRGQASAFWQKAFIFCQSLAGEHDKAALGLELLREVGEQDAVFFGLIDSLRGAEKFVIESLPKPRPLHLAMVRAARVRLPADVTSTDDPSVLRNIATSPNARARLRLDAAERAEAMGALSTEILRQLYTAVTFTDDALNNTLTRSETDRSPLSRALLYRKALVEGVPTALAEVLSRSLKLAREGGRYHAAARIYQRILSGLAPSRDLLWFAPEAIRALLAAGDAEGAKRWFAILRAGAIFDQQSADLRERLLPLARLTGAEEAAAWKDEILVNWWRAEIAAAKPDEEAGKAKEAAAEIGEDAVRRAALMYNLLEATGDRVPRELWTALLIGSPHKTAVMPQAALWRSLSGAAEANRLGETVLLALLALGQAGPTQGDPLTLHHVVASLMRVGLETAARRIAVEAAVAAGL